MKILELMAAPFAECLILVAIHTYLGIHVLKRRVIFVDLALAQIAALGTTVGFLFGIMPETPGALVFSMAFTFVGAGVFSITRFKHERVPQEAIIGLTYAICCAIAVLVVEKTKGAEHLKDILVGNLLWVKWTDVALAGSVYLVIGILHYIHRKTFLLISDDAAAAHKSGVRVRAWDFLFYLTFGIVIAFSTRVAGVLLVFVFLVAPAILAFLLTDKLWLQLIIGWTTGTIVTVVGLYLSWTLDLPSGPAVIAFYGVVLAFSGVTVYIWRAPNRARALAVSSMGFAGTVALAFGFYVTGKWLGTTSMSISDGARTIAADISAENETAAREQSTFLENHRGVLAARTNRCVGGNKLDRYLSMAGPEERLAHAKLKLSENLHRGLEFLLLALADDDLPLLYREEAAELLVSATRNNFGYDSQVDAKHNQEAVVRICDRLRALKKQGNVKIQTDN